MCMCMCHMSCVLCHVSHFLYCVAHVMCKMACTTTTLTRNLKPELQREQIWLGTVKWGMGGGGGGGGIH